MPEPREKTLLEGAFLLDPRNAPLVAGKARRPAGDDHVPPLALAVVLLVLGLSVNAWLGEEWVAWLELRLDGRTAPAEILALSADAAAPFGRRHSISYRFSVGEGRDALALDGNHSITAGAYRRLHGSTFTSVRYHPADPSLSRVQGAAWPGSAAMLAVTLLFVVVATLLPFLLLRGTGSLIARTWLGRRGLLFPGEVVACVSERGRRGERIVTLRYRARLGSGRMVSGEVSRRRDDLDPAALPRPGDRVAVLASSPRLHRLL